MVARPPKSQNLLVNGQFGGWPPPAVARRAPCMTESTGRHQAGVYIRSTVSIPSSPSPFFNVPAVNAHSLRRLSRRSPGASRTGHVS